MQLSDAAEAIGQKLGAETTEVTTSLVRGGAAGRLEREVAGSSDTGRKRRLASVRAGYHTGSARDFADRAAADRRLELPARRAGTVQCRAQPVPFPR